MTTSTPSEKKAKDKDVSPLVLTAEPGSASNHFNIDVQFPVYSIDWLSNDIILLAGGGGSSRTGVRNRLVGTFTPSRLLCCYALTILLWIVYESRIESVQD